mmetsp:Transcript_33721/g.36340  ORF Transcript_33721/g.36340 Transcript_33721/m.36340 type:complete len:129 (+) Transcript_33721:106-492(+)
MINASAPTLCTCTASTMINPNHYSTGENDVSSLSSFYTFSSSSSNMRPLLSAFTIPSTLFHLTDKTLSSSSSLRSSYSTFGSSSLASSSIIDVLEDVLGKDDNDDETDVHVDELLQDATELEKEKEQE